MPARTCKHLPRSLPDSPDSGVLSGLVSRRRLLALFIVLLAGRQAALAQQAVSSTLAATAAASNIQQQQQNDRYVFKNGDFRLFVTPSVSLQWNDNISLTKVNPQSDFIVTPLLGIEANYPIGKQNLLNLTLSVGYEKYFDHDEYSQFVLNGGSASGLSFDLVVKDVRFNFHNRFQFAQQGAQQGVAAGPGAGTYGTFVNTSGLAAFWDVSRLTFVLGYDHQITLATSSQFNQVNQSSDLFNAQAGYMVDSALTVGLQSTASLVTYQENQLDNNNIFTFGVYSDWKPGEAFKVHGGFGLSLYQPSQSGILNRNQDQNGWYANLVLSHEPLSYLSYALNLGHEITPGFQSSAVEKTYVRPNATWKLIKNVSLNTAVFYEHGDTIGTPLALNNENNYNWYGGELNLSYSPVRKITTSVFYRLTKRTSNVYANEYDQNVVGLQLTYTP